MRILVSGGGGWGSKQGLLSLDPDTSYSAAGEGDVESFIRAFRERNKPGATEGVVVPGSCLLFCTEPQWAENDATASGSPHEAMMTFGVAPADDEEQRPARVSHPVEVIANHFGAASQSGIYLGMSPQGSPGARRRLGLPDSPFRTKLDVPRSTVSVSY